MKKVLLSALFILNLATCLFAQNKTAFYYYKGKKIFVPVNYDQLVAGIKKETAFAKYNSVNGIADNLKINRSAVRKITTANQFVINPGKDEPSGKALQASMLIKDFIAYVHPCLVGPGGKLASYGDEFVVKLKTGISLTLFNNLLVQYNCSIIKPAVADKLTYLLSAGKANSYDALAMANTFFESGLFEYAQPDFTSYDGLNDAPNDPLYNLQWAHKNTGTPAQYNGVPGADLQVDSAWLITMGSSTIKIAVIDTGVDTAQADIKSNLLQGYDCTTQTSNPGDGRPLNIQNAHGTACAGIIASEANNNIGTAGIAPNCKIIPINLSNEFNVFADEFGIASGIDYAWQHGADVLTNSWDLSLPSNVIDDAIHRAVTLGRGGKGAIVFVATGNENSGISYPSSNPEVVAVGGTNMCNQRKSPTSCDGEFWWGANYGIGLDIVAPCIDIATADNTGANGYNKTDGSSGDYYNLFGGTSSACPHAAAVAALVLSVDPNFTATEVRTIIETNCTKAGDYIYALNKDNINGTWNNEMGYGRVNAYKAVLAAQSKKFCNVAIKSLTSSTLCKNASINLAIANNVPGTYIWRQNGAIAGTGNSITVSQAGMYEVLAQYANGCTATSAPVTIILADTVLKADAGKEIFICAGSNGVLIGGEPAASGGNPFISNKRAWGYDVLLGNIIRFNLDNPREYETVPLIPSAEVSDFDFTAGDFTPYGYYALTRTGNLFKIDTSNGQETYIGLLASEPADNAGHEWSGLAWDPSVKKLYALSAKGTVNKLYEVNPFDASTVPGIRINNISWIAFNKNGDMYGFYTNLRWLTKINKLTGEATTVSNAIGVASTQYLDGAVDPLDGKVYMPTSVFVNNKLTQDLYIIDPATSKAFVQGHIGTLNTVTSLTISGGTYNYSWSPAAGLSATNIANPVANPLSPTTYTLTVTDACGQTANSTVKVNPNSAAPVVNITAAKDSICVGETTRLSVTRDSTYSYQWYLNDAGIPGATDSFYTAQRMGDFKVRVTTPHNGCINTSSAFTVKDCSIWLNNNTTDTTCYAYFYPSHGYGQNYSPGEFFIKTIYPSRHGDLLKLKFTSFSMQNFNDVLTVYNGADTNAPIIGQFKVNVSPPKNVTYYSTTGPLTFRMRSSDDITSTGTWEAFLECFTPKVYRSQTSGLFESIYTWEVKTGPNTYATAETLPQYLDDSIIIQSGHNLTLTTNVSVNVDQLWLQRGASLLINGNLGIANGAGTDLIADGNITMGQFGTLNGSNGSIMEANGNLYGENFYLYMPCYVNGDAAQSFQSASVFFKSLHMINNNGLTVNGYLKTDSLFMNTNGKLIVDSAEVTYLLKLDSGIIDVKTNGGIKPSSSLRLAVEGGNANSYVSGSLSLPIRVSGNYILKYPIGRNGFFKPITLTIDQHSFPYENLYKAELINSAPFNFTIPNGIQNVSALRYYKITLPKLSPVTSAAITLPYDADDAVTDPANLRIVRDSANKWINAGGAGLSPAPGTITSTNLFTTFNTISSSGYFALANAAATVYTFTGNGNWSNAANWSNNQKPPAALMIGEIIIDPQQNGECILDTPQTIAAPAKLTVVPGRKFTVNANLGLLQ